MALSRARLCRQHAPQTQPHPHIWLRAVKVFMTTTAGGPECRVSSSLWDMRQLGAQSITARSTVPPVTHFVRLSDIADRLMSHT